MNYRDIYVHLNNLKKSGITNMFDASSYIELVFGMDKQEAHAALVYWMEHYEELQYLKAEEENKVESVDELKQLKDRVAFLEGLLKRIVKQTENVKNSVVTNHSWYLGYYRGLETAKEIALLAFED